jgi:hypothetical protein
MLCDSEAYRCLQVLRKKVKGFQKLVKLFSKCKVQYLYLRTVLHGTSSLLLMRPLWTLCTEFPSDAIYCTAKNVNEITTAFEKKKKT